MDCFSVQFQAQCGKHFQNGVETRNPVTRKRFVKVLARKTGIACNLCHTFCTPDAAQCFGDEG